MSTLETHLTTGMQVSPEGDIPPAPPSSQPVPPPPPVDQFTASDLPFSRALDAMKAGYVASRDGWNGDNMELFLADAGTFSIGGSVQGSLQPFIVMRTADGTFVPWLASATDLVSEDWTVSVPDPL